MRLRLLLAEGSVVEKLQLQARGRICLAANIPLRPCQSWLEFKTIPRTSLFSMPGPVLMSRRKGGPLDTAKFDLLRAGQSSRFKQREAWRLAMVWTPTAARLAGLRSTHDRVKQPFRVAAETSSTT